MGPQEIFNVSQFCCFIILKAYFIFYEIVLSFPSLEKTRLVNLFPFNMSSVQNIFNQRACVSIYEIFLCINIMKQLSYVCSEYCTCICGACALFQLGQQHLSVLAFDGCSEYVSPVCVCLCMCDIECVHVHLCVMCLCGCVQLV